MVSMKEIAAKCEVSIATVSKALNDQSDISQATKERINAVAKEMGYLPNTAARALKTKRTDNIGVLFADEALSGLTHDYFSFVLDSFKKEAESRGYDITFINCSKEGNRGMTYLEKVRSRGFDGVVIACINFEAPEVIELVQSGIPIVTIDYIFNNTMTVCSNNAKGMSDLMNHVISMGHRKIAYIHGADSAVTRTRLAVFHQVAERNGIQIPDEYIREAAYRSTKACYNRTLELLDLPDPPTVILYPDDFASFGGKNAIEERGLRIPDDVSVVGYDGIRVCRYIEPKLTTLRQDTDSIGRQAAIKLIEQIERPRSTVIEQIIVDGEVFEGSSVKRITRQ